jgi:hypothetical protein
LRSELHGRCGLLFWGRLGRESGLGGCLGRRLGRGRCRTFWGWDGGGGDGGGDGGDGENGFRWVWEWVRGACFRVLRVMHDYADPEYKADFFVELNLLQGIV